jgi:oligopeptide transport system permease protein
MNNQTAMAAAFFLLIVAALIGGSVLFPDRLRGQWFHGGKVAAVLLTSAAVFAAATIVVRAAPGGPFDTEAKLDPTVRARLAERAAAGRDDWFSTFDGLLRGDLGPSLALRDFEAGDLLRDGAKRSFALGLRAILAAAVFGAAAGAAAARRPGGAVDRVVRAVALFCLGLPTFAWAAILIAVFSFAAGMVPPASLGGRPLALPATAAALAPAAVLAHLVRNEILRLRDAPFAAAATARGASRVRRFFVHVLPAALIPAAAYLGPAAAALLTGSLAVESVFGIPGLGTHLVQAALARDFPVVAGAATIYAAALGAFGILADAAARALDPRLGAR